MVNERCHSNANASTIINQLQFETNITRQVLQTIVPIEVVDLLQSILELQNALVSRNNEIVHATTHLEPSKNEDPITKHPL
jgi:hypothetical protein